MFGSLSDEKFPCNGKTKKAPSDEGAVKALALTEGEILDNLNFLDKNSNF